MKLLPTAVGFEPKKVALLAAILIIGAVAYWFQNRSSAPAETVSATATAPASVTPVKPVPAETVAPAPVPAVSKDADPPVPGMQRRYPNGAGFNDANGSQDFHPTLKVKEDADLSRVDPRIQLDMLEKVRAVPMEGGSSSLFEFGKPPEPPAPPVAPIHPSAPAPVPPPAAATAAKQIKTEPPPPPIPYKYYGYAGKSADGQLQEGFFLEGDLNNGNIEPVREGETLKNRYKVIRIGIKSATVEDTVAHKQQDLELIQEQQ